MDHLTTLLFQGEALYNAESAGLALEQAEPAEALSSLVFVQAGLENGGSPDEATLALTGTVDHFVEAMGRGDFSGARALKKLLAGQIRSLNDRSWQRVFVRTPLHRFSPAKKRAPDPVGTVDFKNGPSESRVFVGLGNVSLPSKPHRKKKIWLSDVRFRDPVGTLKDAEGWVRRGIMHQLKGEYREAALLYRKAGFIFEAESQWEKALDAWRKAADTYRGFQQHQWEGEVEVKAAHLCKRLGNTIEALVHFSRALFAFRKAGVEEEQLRDIAMERFKAFQKAVGVSGSPREILERGVGVLRQLAHIHESAGEQKLEGLVHDAMADAFAHLGDTISAMSEYDKAVELFLKAEEFLEAASASRKIAIQMDRTGSSPVLIAGVYREAATHFERGGDRKTAAEMLQKQVKFLKKGKAYRAAAEALEKAFAMDPRDLLNKAKIYFSLGVLRRKLEQWGPAAIAFEMSAALFEKMEEHRLSAGSLGLASLVLLRMDEDVDPENCWNRALEARMKGGGVIYVEAELFFTLGEVLRDEEEYEEAIEMFTKAAHWFEKVGVNPLAGSAYEAIGGLELKLGRPAKAAQTLKKAKGLYQIMKDRAGVQRAEAALREAETVQ